jgi:integrase
MMARKKPTMAKIDLPYVKAYRDRTGVWRYYFRRNRRVYGAISGKPGSAEFMQAYQEFLGSPAPKAARHEHGTMGHLIASFYASPGFVNLKPVSKTLYRRAVLEPFAEKHGHRLIRDIRRDKLSAYIEGIGATKPAMANTTRSVLNRLMKYAVTKEWCRDNPIAGMDRYKIGSHHTWTDAELAQFEAAWPVGTRERLAYALLLYTGQRGGDVVRMSRRDIVDGYIHVVQEKTGADLQIPIHPVLMAVIKATPSKGFAILARANGKPIQRQTLTAMMAKAVAAAGLPDHCVPHGIRKSTMRRLAEGGATSKEIAAISGHQTLKEIERYTDAADQKKLGKSAMATITSIKDRT